MHGRFLTKHAVAQPSKRHFSLYFRIQRSPVSPYPFEQQLLRKRRPYLFACGAIAGIYLGCSFISNVQDLYRAKSAFRLSVLPSWDDLQRSKKELGWLWQRLKQIKYGPETGTSWLTNNVLVDKWQRSTDAQKCIYGLIATNVAIFGLFTVFPTLAMRAAPFFVSHPVTSPSVSMLFSCFSHANLAHLGFNMMALYSFGPYVASSFGDPWAFMAFYLSTGIISSLAQNRMGLFQFKRGFEKTLRGCLGASGALYSVLGAACILQPNASVRLLFIPIDLPILPTFSCLMGVDLLGGILCWSLFGHWVIDGCFGIMTTKYADVSYVGAFCRWNMWSLLHVLSR